MKFPKFILPFLLFLSSCSFKANYSYQEEPIENDVMNAAEETKNSLLVLKNKKGQFNSNYATLEFAMDNHSELSFDQKECVLLSVSREKNSLVLFVKILSTEAKLSVTAELENVVDSIDIYLYQDKFGILYYSDLSIDSAIKESLQDKNEAYSYEFASQSLDFHPISWPVQRAKTISCDFSWMDTNGTKFPLVGASVSVKTASGKVNKKETDSNGNVYFDFNSDSSFIGGGKEYLSARWTEIKNNKYTLSLSLENSLISVIDNYKNLYSISINNEHIKGEDSKTVNLCYTPMKKVEYLTSDFGAARQIFQSMHYYSSHAEKLAGIGKISKCIVQYPTEDDGDFYSGNTQTICIGNQSSNNQSLKSFESWDTFGHEYGHHLEKNFGFSTQQGGKHSSVMDDSFSFYINSKDKDGHYAMSFEEAKLKGLRLAWAEAWPTFWATIAQQSFPDYLKKESYLSIGDDKYQSSNFGYLSGTNIPISNYLNPKETSDGEINLKPDIHSGHKGDGCELTIIRFLYQLWDSDNDDVDQLSISEEDFWNLLVDLSSYYQEIGTEKNGDDKIQFFYQVLAALEDFHGFDNVATLAEHYGLCPTSIKMIGERQLRWSNNLESNGDMQFLKELCNNRFIISLTNSRSSKLLYLNSGDYIVPDIEAGYYQYALSDEDIQLIRNMGDQCELSIRGYYELTSKKTRLGPVISRKSAIQFK